MKHAVRVIAECVSSGAGMDGPDNKLVCDVIMEDGTIVRNRYYGATYEAEFNEWFPFILRPKSGADNGGILEWGGHREPDGACCAEEPVTLFDRKAKVGEYFSRVRALVDGETDEWTYKITHVIDMTA